LAGRFDVLTRGRIVASVPSQALPPDACWFFTARHWKTTPATREKRCERPDRPPPPFPALHAGDHLEGPGSRMAQPRTAFGMLVFALIVLFIFISRWC